MARKQTEKKKEKRKTSICHLKGTKTTGNKMKWREYHFPKLLSEKDLHMDEGIALPSCLAKGSKKGRHDLRAGNREGSSCFLRRPGKFGHWAFSVLCEVCMCKGRKMWYLSSLIMQTLLIIGG